MTDLEKAFEEACSRHDGTNFVELGEVDRILLTVWGLEGEVNNGGFNQYYFNSAGDQAFFAADALRAIGALQMAEIVTRANAVFGPSGLPRDRERRQDELLRVAPDDSPDPWDQLDRAFYEYPDDIGALLSDFLESRNA
jgi:hypothetical protein